MFRRAPFAALALLSSVAALPWLHAQTPPKPDPVAAAAAPNKPIPAADAADLAKVDAALPATARAKPQRERRLLVTARTQGYFHNSIPVALHAVEQLGARTGAYRVEFNHEMSAFTAENLARFDAIAFVSNTLLEFPDPASRAALLDFVASGKGIAGIHAAADNFYSWPEGQALLGGVFHSHPWNAGDTVAVKVDEPTHPIVAAFRQRGFWVTDEIYQIVGPYGRDQQRVLLSLDWSRRRNHRPDDKLVRADRDFPIAWVKTHGRGRVFYSSLGHNVAIYQTPEVLQHYLDGIQFALGDLAAPAEPSSTLQPAPSPAPAPLIERTLFEAANERADVTRASASATLSALARLTANSDPAVERLITAALRVMDAPTRHAYERTLLDVAARPEVTDYARNLIAEWLGAIGSEASLPQLRSWAEKPATADAALRTLVLIPGAAADAALTQLLTTAPASARVTVVDALGRRRVAAAVAGIVPLLRAEDATLAAASLDTLGRIASPAAIRALDEFAPPPALAEAQNWARLAAARQVATTGDAAQGLALARALPTRAQLTPAQEVAAAETLLQHDPARALRETLPLFSRAYVGAHLARPWLATALAAPDTAAALALLVPALPTLPEPVQLALLANATSLAHPAFVPLAQAALDPARPTPSAIRAAALAALGACGDLTTADTLIAALASTGDRAAATAALARQRTPGLEARLRAAVTTAAPAQQATLLEILAGRVDREAVPLLVEAARSADRAARAAGYRGLATLARAEDLDLILSLRDQLQPADRRHWQTALLAAIRGRNDVAGSIALLRREIATAGEADRPAFCYALAGLDDPSAIAALRELLAGTDAEVRKGLIRALASLRNDNAYLVLIGFAEDQTHDQAERVLALRGYIDTLGRRQDRWTDTMDDLARAYRAAQRQEERDAALAGLRAFDHPAATQRIQALTAASASHS